MIRVLLLILTVTVTTALHLNKYHAPSISLMLAPLAHEDDSINRIIIVSRILLPSTFPISLHYPLDKIYTNSLFRSVVYHKLFNDQAHLPQWSGSGIAVRCCALLRL